MVVKNGLACGIMLALVGCATKPVSNEQATPVPEKQIISTALLEKRDGTGEGRGWPTGAGFCNGLCISPAHRPPQGTAYRI